MKLLIAKRRKDWKKRTIEKLQHSNTFVSAMYQFMDEYLYYTRDEKELKRRLKKLLWEIDKQLSNLIRTRGTEFATKTMCDMKKDFSEMAAKLEK